MNPAPMTRLLLDSRFIAERRGVELTLAVPEVDGPLTLDGGEVWKSNGLSVSIARDEATGHYRGWMNTRRPDLTDHQKLSLPAQVDEVRSEDGLVWFRTGRRTLPVCVLEDHAEPNPARRFKCIYQGRAVLDDQGNVEISMDRHEAFMAAARAGRKVSTGMFSACSPDGIEWQDHRVVVINTYARPWQPGDDLGRNADVAPETSDRWWKPNLPGWAGGDNFPCLIHDPVQQRYVTFYRTNLDRRTSHNPRPQRRERAVGRSDCSDFGQWGPHELALHAQTTWQKQVGHQAQDFYQMQVFRAGSVYLGVVSVFYWEEDRLHLELAWSPDTIHWERVCPYHDLVPHGEVGEFGGGCCHASMAPFVMGDEVMVYHGATNGRHNADSCGQATLRRARFKRDRFAGLWTGSDGGVVLTVPFEMPVGGLSLNATAPGGEIRAALCDEAGQPLPGCQPEDCQPLAEDALEQPLRWKGWRDALALPKRMVCLRLQLRNATAYAVGLSSAPSAAK